MAAKHTVYINESFEQRIEVGALMLEGRQIAPPRVNTFTYTKGDRITFHTKDAAVQFAKHHQPKVSYLGKV